MPAVATQRRPLRTMDRPEFIAQVSLDNLNKTYTLPTNGGQLPNDRFMSGILLTFKGRMTNPGSGNPTAVLAEGLFGLVDKIRVSGYHRPSSADLEIINMSGGSIRAMDAVYSGTSLEVTPSSLSVSASATNDFVFSLYVPFIPRSVHPRDAGALLLDAPNWSRLALEIKWADHNSVFSGHSSAVTFSAYGSTTGSPTCDVSGYFALEPGRFQGFLPGRLRRYEIPFAANLTTTATGVRLVDLPRGYMVRASWLKVGVTATGATSGNRAFATLSDSILTQVKVNRGLNRMIAQYASSAEWRYHAAQAFRAYPPAGYVPIDWVRRGSMAEIIDLRNAVQGPQGDVDFFVEANVSGAANQSGLVIMEELIAQPKVLGVR